MDYVHFGINFIRYAGLKLYDFKGDGSKLVLSRPLNYYL